MAIRTTAQRKLEMFSQGKHYVRAAAASRQGATKRIIRAGQIQWRDDLHGRNAYMIDSITGFNSKNLAMFIREIPPAGATGSHHHNFEAIAYVLEGRGHDVHDGKTVAWKKGDGLYIPPLVEHQHVNDDPGRSAWLLFVTNWPLLNHLGITLFVQRSGARGANGRAVRNGRVRRRSR